MTSISRPAPKAHPRSRGENRNTRILGNKLGGSSPLTRGKLEWLMCLPDGHGLIPAHAGKTARLVLRGRRVWAHPRSRGENHSHRPPSVVRVGSSPLTRGKHYARRYRRLCPGLIPAHAGKTPRPTASSTPTPAHPRSRGENTSRITPVRALAGSSPLTRGKRRLLIGGRSDLGLIPAHAGKTPAGWRGRTSLRAHPRSRGENSACVTSRPVGGGSSPLTRGKPRPRHPEHVPGGLIPAHAGKTIGRSFRGCRCSAHPRSRGENR